ncbi:MAG: hypothetical protein ACRDO1_12925 [Nocardioidaceae bacterium]
MAVSTDHPDLLPLLARGKHRNPRRGACFMELASFLAGERWSDHPSCTHPLLSSLARLVNDHTSDQARPRLAPLIPSVIGLTSEEVRWDAEIALHTATSALPIAPAERQQALAVGVFACERMLADLDGREPGSLRDSSRRALASAPHAERWARKFSRYTQVSVRRFRRDSAPTIVRCGVQGIATACVSDADERMYDLLVAVIDDCVLWSGRDRSAAPLEPAAWADVCHPAETAAC